jgi:hypothetical protein
MINKAKIRYDTKPPLHKTLKGMLHTEDENKHNHERTGSIKPQTSTQRVA